MIHRGASPRIGVVAVLLAFIVVSPVRAQETAGQETKTFSQEELEQVAAPIALYPDDVVAQILMASTYPLEVVEAGRWQQSNASLTGDALATALEQQSWDPSVKSLIQFPEVLKMMSEKLDWTQKLGDAVIADQAAVMTAVQELRRRAQDAGNLESTEQQKVVVESETIIIQPADPQVIYVPTYNPTVVYGTWPYPSYPPYYYPPPSYYRPGAATVGFLTGVAVGAAWGYAWGECGWRGRGGDIDIDVNRNVNLNRNIDRNRYGGGNRGGGTWRHDPTHRKGTRYRDNRTAQQFGRGKVGGRDARPSNDIRGHAGRAGNRGAGPNAGRGGNLGGERAGNRGGERGGNLGGERAGSRGTRPSGSRNTGASRQRSSVGSSSRSRGSAFGNSSTRSSRSATSRHSSRGRSSRGHSGGRSRGGGGRRGGRR